jgi:hypothetical protein
MCMIMMFLEPISNQFGHVSHELLDFTTITATLKATAEST